MHNNPYFLVAVLYVPMTCLNEPPPVTGNNVKATDRRKWYGSDGAQGKPWLYRPIFKTSRRRGLAENL